jgi:hypothetical protein
VVEAAVFALLGLLLAFQFSAAASRLQMRRELTVREANTIGTAYLRLDLLPAREQPALRDLFRRYADTRIRVWQQVTDADAFATELAATQQLQDDIWSRAVAACRKESDPAGPLLVVPALNDMIDITTSRTVAARTHAPLAVLALLFGVALLSALLAGFAMSVATRRPVLHMILFATVTAVTVYMILDLEFPRIGLIRVGAADQALVEVRQSMK